jgi:putative peptidoglycan lipid II flippase
MSLVKSTATIGGYTLISRVLGFLRDITIASSLGAGMFSDAFFVAFKLPNFLRRLFAEGAFNSAFVPIFAGMLATDGEEKAKEFAGEAMSFLVVLLIGVTGVFMVFMPWLMFILAPGFADNPEKYDLTVLLTRITFPYIIFISLVSLLGGILNSNHKFAAVAATPIIMNLCLIIIPSLIGWATPSMAHALSIAVMISGVLQWLWLVHFAKRQHMLPKFGPPRLSPNVKRLLVLIAPAALGAGVAQVNLFIDLIIASQFNSGVSYLYYADRISELPLAVIGIAVGTAILPMLSKQIREGNDEAAYRTQRHAIELALFLSVPAAAALITLAQPIITVMYERGAFGPLETDATFPTLIAFACGLPAFVLIKILAPGFYAHHDTKTPFKIATLCIVVNLAFNLILMGPFKWVGMAMATTISGWLNVALMTTVLIKRKWLVANNELIKQISLIIGISAVMAGVVYAATAWLEDWLAGGEIMRFSALTIIVMLGLASYAAAALAVNCMDIRRHGLKLVKRA